MPNTSIVNAYILKKIPYGNSSWILHVLSAEEGRFSVLAKGARKSKKAGLYEYFHYLELSIVKREGLSLLNNVESLHNSRLEKDALWLGFYLNELSLRLLKQNMADENIFASYHQAVTQLMSVSEPEFLLRQFESSLLEMLGVMPDFSLDIMQNVIDDNAAYYIRHEGLVRLDAALSPSNYEIVLQGRVVNALQNNLAQNKPLDAEQRQAHKRIMRYLIHQQLDGKPLYSRKWFERLKR